MGFLYICSQQRCYKGGRAWMYSFGLAEALASNQSGEYKQLCPNCKASMIRFGPEDPVFLSQLLIDPEQEPGDGKPWERRETKRKKRK